jgi:class 3 adenylate cyclase
VSEETTTRSAHGAGQVRTFLIADVRGFTRFTRDHGDEAAAALAMRFADVARAAVADWDGEVLGLRGDELAAAFASPRQAVQAAVELQQRFADELRANPALPLLVGIGLDAGESVAVEDGYRGGALNLAARLCSRAKAGEVLVSDTVEHLAGRRQDIGFADHGRHLLKGIAERVHIFKVVFPLDLPNVPVAASARRWTPIRLAVLAMILAALAGVAGWAATRGGSHQQAVAIPPNSLAKIDVKTRRVVGDVALSGRPGEVVSGDGALWVGEGQLIDRVDPETREVSVVSAAMNASELAFGEGSLWAYDPLDSLAAQIDPDLSQGALPTLVPLPQCLTSSLQPILIRYNCKLGGIAVGGGSVWIGRNALGGPANDDGGVVWQVDPGAKKGATVTRAIRNVPAARVAYGDGSIWTSAWVGAAYAGQLDAVAARPLHRWPVPGGIGGSSQNPGLVYDFGYAWLVSPPTGDLLVLGSARNEVGASGFLDHVPLPPGSQEVVSGGGFLWVASSAGTVTQINPYRRVPVQVYQLGHPVSGLAYLDGHIWAGVTGS